MVYSCIEDKMYTAQKGKGAFCNGQPLHVSDQKGKRDTADTIAFGIDGI